MSYHAIHRHVDYREGAALLSVPERPDCPACRHVEGEPYAHIHGSVCWHCGFTPHGYRPTPHELVYMRRRIIEGIAALVRGAAHHEQVGLGASWRAKYGAEVKATILRAPDDHHEDVRQRARDALARAMPTLRPLLG